MFRNGSYQMLRWKFLALGTLAMLATGLSACGGGGGGGDGGGGGGGGPSVSGNPGSLSFSAAVNDPLVPNPQVHLTFSGVPASAQTIKIDFSNSGISDVAAEFTSPTTVLLTLVLRPPASLKPAARSDQVLFTLCSDSACANTVAGTGGSFSVSYTVTAAAAGNEPALAFAQNPLTVQDLAISVDLPTAITDAISFSHVANPPYLSVDNSGAPAVTGTAYSTSSTEGVMDIQPGAPSQVGAGTWATNLKVTACLDDTCANPFPGSPFTVTVNYVVGDWITGPDPYGYNLSAAQQNLLTMAWDPIHSSVYTLLPLGLATVASVAPYDPTTKTLGTPANLADNGTGALAVSDDGQYLYVGVADGTVQRFQLPSLTPDLVIPLGMDGSGNPYYANAIQVAPGAAHTIAVGESNFTFVNNPGGEAGVAIFDDNVQRPKRADGNASMHTGAAVDSLAWKADGSALYGTGSAVPGLLTFVVDAQGISSYASAGTFAGTALHGVGSTLYLDGGEVIDTTTGQVTTPFAALGPIGRVLPDPADGRVFVADAVQAIRAQKIYAVDISSGVTLASLQLPQLFDQAAQSIDWILARGGTLPGPMIVITVPSYVGVLQGTFVGP